MIRAVIVRLPVMSRPVVVPVMAKLVIKDTHSKSRLWLARRMAERLAAALHALPSARTGRPGRPRVKGERLPSLAEIAAGAEFSQVTVIRYGRADTVGTAAVTCLWYSVFGSLPVTVVLVRDKPGTGFGIAFVTTDTAATVAQVIESYAARWSIETAIEDAKQIFGTGQARNRTARAVERTVPFQIACQAIAVTRYATAARSGRYLSRNRHRMLSHIAPARQPT